MASANFGMGIALCLASAGAYSIDGWLQSRYPWLADTAWFQWLGRGPWLATRLKYGV